MAKKWLTDAAIDVAMQANKPLGSSAYRRLYLAILNGQLRGERVGGRWMVEIEDAAKLLGVELKAA